MRTVSRACIAARGRYAARVSSLRAPALVTLAACAWLWSPPPRAPALAAGHDGVVVEEPARVERFELVAAEGLPGRRWVRAVRDLVENRFDVDALPPDAPITVWLAGDELVAFELVRPPQGEDPWDDPGGALFAARVTRAGAARWYFDDGTSLDGPTLSRPVRYQAVSSRLGLRDHPIRHRLKWHAGTDYAAPIGTPIRAFADGRVVKATRSWVAGNYVVVKHDDGSEAKYLHMNERAAAVIEGARVRQGEVIGTVGKTGRVTGPHLHFELRDRRGTPIDPTLALWPASVVEDAPAQRVLRAQQRLLDTFLAEGARDWDTLLSRSASGCAPEPPSTARTDGPRPSAVALGRGGRASRVVPPPRRRRLAIARLVFDDAARARRDPLLRRAVELAAEFSASLGFG